MATSGTFTEHARRAQIIAAAIETVNEVGYPHASLSAIAQHAGVAKSAIAYYFTSKELLLMHTLEHVFGELDAQLERAVAPFEQPRDRFVAYLAGYLDYADTHRDEITAGIEIMVSHRTPEGVPLYLTFSEEDSALLGSILAAGMAQGVFRSMDVRTGVGLVEALLDVPVTALQRDRTADLTELKAEIIGTILHGITTPAP